MSALDMTPDDFRAFRAGRLSACMGLPREQNPFDSDEPGHDWWFRGYDAREADRVEE
jgi:hypothetical protein